MISREDQKRWNKILDVHEKHSRDALLRKGVKIKRSSGFKNDGEAKGIRQIDPNRSVD
jgi:hypothetical protein